MLSILIPTYNYVCYELVEELYQQAVSLNITFEILVMDDASPLYTTKEENRKINTLPNCKYIELEKNLGRARIRNYLGENSQYDYLLFLDSDVRICKEDFLKRYLESIQGNRVICGVTRFKRRVPEKDRTLRYTYGITGEEKNAEICNQKPHAQFTSISFLIERNTFLKIKFNELFVKYGHEDTLFGKELEIAQIPVFHINNPIYHNVPDTNEEFLRKTHNSIENTLRYKDLLESHVRLLQMYNKIKRNNLEPFVYLLYKTTKRGLLRNILGTHPNMKLFAFYKLGYLCELDRKQKSRE